MKTHPDYTAVTSTTAVGVQWREQVLTGGYQLQRDKFMTQVINMVGEVQASRTAGCREDTGVHCSTIWINLLSHGPVGDTRISPRGSAPWGYTVYHPRNHAITNTRRSRKRGVGLYMHTALLGYDSSNYNTDELSSSCTDRSFEQVK